MSCSNDSNIGFKVSLQNMIEGDLNCMLGTTSYFSIDVRVPERSGGKEGG